jgi:hypothetical protein
MKSRRIMQLWIMGIIILFSVQGYAADEKITFIPYDVSVQGPAITVSGSTAPKKVRILHASYFEELNGGTIVQKGEILDPSTVLPGSFIIKLYLVIATSESGTVDNYSWGFKTSSYNYLPISVVQFYLKENPKSSDEYSDYGSYKLVATEFFNNVTAPTTAIDIGKTRFEIRGADTFTAHNISLPGYDGLYWGTFQWDPYLLSWKLKDAGAEK